MTNIKALHDFSAFLLSAMVAKMPDYNICRNDAPEELSIPMVCVTPSKCTSEGFGDDTWELTLTVESVQQIDQPVGFAAGRLNDFVEAFMAMECVDNFYVSDVSEREAGIDVSAGSITCSSLLVFNITLNL